MNTLIKIAVVDDHELFVEGVCNLISQISPDYEAIGFTSAEELLKSANTEQHFTLIITDMAMKGINGLALIAALRANDIRTPVIVMSGVVENHSLSEENLIKMGAFAFVHKTAGSEKLKNTVIRALNSDGSEFNERPYAIPQHPSTIGEIKPSKIELPSLGMRQLEVLKLTSSGLSNQDIAEALSISQNTVKSHLQTVYAEFGVNNRTACVNRARELGII